MTTAMISFKRKKYFLGIQWIQVFSTSSFLTTGTFQRETAGQAKVSQPCQSQSIK